MVIALARSLRLSSPCLFGQAHNVARRGAPAQILRCYTAGAPAEAAMVDEAHSRIEGPEPFSATTYEERVPSLYAFASKSAGLQLPELELKFLRTQLRQDQITYEKQRQEADVGSIEKLGCLTIDLPEHRASAEAWTDILQFRHRLHGHQGVRDVWNGMRMRNYQPPVCGQHAHTIWTSITRSIITLRDPHEKEVFLKEVLDEAQDIFVRTGKTCSSIHKTLVGGSFSARALFARDMHEELFTRGLVLPEGLNDIVEDVVLVRSKSMEHIPIFLNLTRSPGNHSMYDKIISSALSVTSNDVALRWHQALLRNGEAPSQKVFRLPEVQRLFEMDRDQTLPMIQKRRLIAGVDELPLPKDFPRLTRSLFSRMVGEAHGIEEKAISGNFVAKLLATRALSLDAVLRGIGILGVAHLNAVCTRELAVRCETSREYLQRANELVSKGVQVASKTVFARMLRQFAQSGTEDLFRALLTSDQHPDNWGDVKLQASLLRGFLASGRNIESQVAHAALMENGDVGKEVAWNLQMQHGLENGQWNVVDHAAKELQALRLPLGSTTLSLLNQVMLSDRSPSHGPQESQRTDKPQYDALHFVTQLYLYADEVGGNVRAMAWIELLKRLGHLQRWLALEKLVLHLAERRRQALLRESFDLRNKSTTAMPDKFHILPDLQRRRHPGAWRRSTLYSAIFNKQMLQALLAWGFRSDTGRNNVWIADGHMNEQQYNDDLWARGLVLLRRIQAKGISIDIELVRHAFILRMWMLFGPQAVADERDAGVVTRQASLAYLVQTANRIWDNKLIPGVNAKWLDEIDPVAHAKLAIHLFGNRARLGLDSSQHNVDVARWLKGLIPTKSADNPTSVNTGTQQRKRFPSSGRRAYQKVPKSHTTKRRLHPQRAAH